MSRKSPFSLVSAFLRRADPGLPPAVREDHLAQMQRLESCVRTDFPHVPACKQSRGEDPVRARPHLQLPRGNPDHPQARAAVERVPRPSKRPRQPQLGDPGVHEARASEDLEPLVQLDVAEPLAAAEGHRSNSPEPRGGGEAPEPRVAERAVADLPERRLLLELDKSQVSALRERPGSDLHHACRNPHLPDAAPAQPGLADALRALGERESLDRLALLLRPPKAERSEPGAFKTSVLRLQLHAVHKGRVAHASERFRRNKESQPALRERFLSDLGESAVFAENQLRELLASRERPVADARDPVWKL